MAAKVAVLLVLDLEFFFLLPFAATALAVVPVLRRDRQAGHVVVVPATFALVSLVHSGFSLLTIRCAFEYLFNWNGE